jgi:hypothetical protein
MLDIIRTEPAIKGIDANTGDAVRRGLTAEPFLRDRVLFQFWAHGKQVGDLVLTAQETIELGEAIRQLGNQVYPTR